MNKKVIAKELIKIAKHILSFKVEYTYRMNDTGRDNQFQFYLKCIQKLDKNEITLDDFIKESKDVEYSFVNKIMQLQKSFKKEDFVNDVKLDKDILGTIVDIKNFEISNKALITLNVDLDGYGSEYSWDRTNDVFKENGWKQNKRISKTIKSSKFDFSSLEIGDIVVLDNDTEWKILDKKGNIYKLGFEDSPDEQERKFLKGTNQKYTIKQLQKQVIEVDRNDKRIWKNF